MYLFLLLVGISFRLHQTKHVCMSSFLHCRLPVLRILLSAQDLEQQTLKTGHFNHCMCSDYMLGHCTFDHTLVPVATHRLIYITIIMLALTFLRLCL